MVRLPVQRLLRAAAACSWVVLAVLSLLPGADRPHGGFCDHVEQALGYALAGGITRLALRRRPSRWQVLGFSLAAACFEICRTWIPGRPPGLDAWAAKRAGALCGIAVVRALVHRLERRRR